MFRQRQKFANRKDYEDPGAEEKYELISQLEKHELYQVIYERVFVFNRFKKVKWFVSSLMSKIFKVIIAKSLFNKHRELNSLRKVKEQK